MRCELSRIFGTVQSAECLWEVWKLHFLQKSSSFAQYANAVQQEIYSERLEFLNFNIDIIVINSQ